MSDPQITTPPTQEWIARNKDNVVVSTGRMATKVPQLRYRNLFEIINDPDVDALSTDYSSAFSLLCSADYAYRVSQRSLAGHRADTSGGGEEGGMPLADLYLKLSQRFTHQKRAVYSQAGSAKDHWETLQMLMQPLPEGKSILATRSALFVIIPDIMTALSLLSEYMEAIQRDWKKAQESINNDCVNERDRAH